MSRTGRLSITLIVLVAGIAAATFATTRLLAMTPTTVNFAAGHQNGQPVNLTAQTVGSIGFGPHPPWVSYLTETPSGTWEHSTIWQVPAHTRINVTIYQYDSGSPLRNQAMGLVSGTIGNKMEVNGKPLSFIDSNAGNGVAHTFTIPTLGINVPLYGNSSTANLCSVAPCLASDHAYAHNVITFSFMSPGPGQYPWQCFIPCGLGYLFGNGGPMQTLGYMDGFLKVVA